MCVGLSGFLSVMGLDTLDGVWNTTQSINILKYLSILSDTLVTFAKGRRWSLLKQKIIILSIIFEEKYCVPGALFVDMKGRTKANDTSQKTKSIEKRGLNIGL